MRVDRIALLCYNWRSDEERTFRRSAPNYPPWLHLVVPPLLSKESRDERHMVLRYIPPVPFRHRK